MQDITTQTLVVLPINDRSSKIINTTFEEVVEFPVKEVINDSCRYFGSSYNGRISGTKKIIGISYKAPIIIEESCDVVFFPTTSPRLSSCIWISLQNIRDYKKCGRNTIINFINGYNLEVNVSYNVIENQILRSARLLMLQKNRKLKKN